MEKPDQIKLERVAKRLAESAENGHAAELTAEESLICLHVFKVYAQTKQDDKFLAEELLIETRSFDDNHRTQLD